MANTNDTFKDDPTPQDADICFRGLCHHTGVAVVATDRNLRINLWNRAAARMFGAAAEQMHGTTVVRIIPRNERAAAEELFKRALSDGAIDQFEFCSPDAQGERRRLAAMVSPIVNDNGNVVGTSACIRDITNRILLQEQLAQNKKMASLGSMAGAIAHYFNNILGGVITSVDFALASGDADMQKRVLEKTAAALGRASSLGNSLLTFAEGNFRTADLADLTETFIEVVDGTENELRGSGITLTVKVGGIPVTAIPAVQFRTALSNVINNAIEAMPDGGELTVELEDSANGYVVRVSDTGCGVSEELRERLFEPFYSTKSSARDGGENTGAGLGLAVAHGIVTVLGGCITCQSRVGEGAVFEIHLPTSPRLPAD